MRDLPISIRRATPEDASAMTALMSEEAVYGNLLQLPHPTEATWRERLQAKSSNGGLARQPAYPAAPCNGFRYGRYRASARQRRGQRAHGSTHRLCRPLGCGYAY